MTDEPGWDLYRSFLAVLKERSLSGAARRLGLTQPTIARHLDALEQALGAQLFLRSPRGLAPTDLAIDLGPYARALAANAAALRRAASGATGEVRGTVRVSASEVVGAIHLPPVLADLRASHPRLVIELVLTNAVENVLERAADIAVRMAPPAQQALLARHLPPLRIGLHAHRAYVARKGLPESLDDLVGHDLIGFDSETPAIRAVMARYPMLGRAAYALRSDSDLAQLAAIRAGFGIGFCQAAIARREPDLVPVLPDAFALDLPVAIVMHEDLKASARHRVVFDALVHTMGTIASL
ncbi:LysR family transcriptional regulator [Ancylobacter radicis]|uniref:LysR family transcriptional regulator n=1 Tax=Ancylobacter radicis TaxID=2836179 RepID=A0ABS5R2T0_9HYPH|nr:LysR family transcriptional regulator [Ancylobacter radicis]MBS9475956.1 LysR family transcriptional regulator [Ancylobacter radicis]